MKKFYSILLAFMLLALVSHSQNKQTVERKYVLLEIATGTWCVYCPGAAMAADDLEKEGKLVGIIENHNGDTYENSSSSSRNVLYNIQGFPTGIFDGKAVIEGGNPSASMYSSYLPEYKTAILAESDFEIITKVVETPDANYDLTITLNNVALRASDKMVLNVVYSESHIPQAWYNNLKEVNFVNRGFFPGPDGTKIDYQKETQTFDISVKTGASWQPDNSKIIIFVQDMKTNEVLQTDVIDLADLTNINKLKENGFNIYPNPTTDFVNIEFANTINENYTVEISDITGKKVYSKNQKSNDNNLSVDVRNFTQGLYFVNIISKNHNFSQKISIVK